MVNQSLKVAIIIPSSDVHLVGVVSSYEGSSANGPYLPVSEGDNAFGCAAGKVGGRALMVRVEGGPAILAAPCVRTVAGFMPRVLAMAFETVDMG